MAKCAWKDDGECSAQALEGQLFCADHKILAKAGHNLRWERETAAEAPSPDPDDSSDREW